MVLESIIDPEHARKNPSVMFIDAIILSSIAIFLSFYIFPSNASILNIAFITIASMPIIHEIFKQEEQEEADSNGHFSEFFKRHGNLIEIYGYFFLGLVVSYSFWFMALPAFSGELCVAGTCFALPTQDAIFSEQSKTLGSIDELNAQLTGKLGFLPEQCRDFYAYFETIFFNNAFVLLLVILFSFVYGAGALFVISWNASIIGAKIGESALGLLGQYQGAGLLQTPLAYAHGLFNSLGLLPHGIFELPGFFVGAIAGGIVSIAISKRKYNTNEFNHMAKDAFLLVVIALILVFIGAVIEAYFISISC